MHCSKRILLAALVTSLLLQAVSQAGNYVDVLDKPAIHSELAIKSPLLGVTLAGERLVAVGVRSHILYSDDQGSSWRQASVPLSSDLTAVSFPTPTQGWAVGHDGVILHSSDSGTTWSKQLDGRQIGPLMLDAANSLAATDPDNEAYAALVADAERMVAEGADKPLLDVWFADDSNGYVVGAFGIIMRTRDGGNSWTALNDQTDNPQGFHLYQIGVAGNQILIVGEQGLVLRLDPQTQRFTRVETPYDGSYFGAVVQPGNILIYGLRGNAFRSTDDGQSWSKIPTGIAQSLTASTVAENGNIFLFSQTGTGLVSHDGGASFASLAQESHEPISAAVAEGNDALVLVGPRGVRVLPLIKPE